VSGSIPAEIEFGAFSFLPHNTTTDYVICVVATIFMIYLRINWPNFVQLHC